MTLLSSKQTKYWNYQSVALNRSWGIMNKASCCDGWCFSWKDGEGQKKRDNMSLTSTHKSKRIQSSWLLGVFPLPPRFHNLEIRDGKVSIYIVASLQLLARGRGERERERERIFPTESDVQCCRGGQNQHTPFCCCSIVYELFIVIIILVTKHQNQAPCDGKGTHHAWERCMLEILCLGIILGRYRHKWEENILIRPWKCNLGAFVLDLSDSREA